MKNIKFLSLFFLTISSIQFSKAQDWTYLIAESWSQYGGKAKYQYGDGQITGTTVSNTPNSFLTTDKYYGDFILELEIMVDPSLNSGVQIRSNSDASYQNGRVHGYQVEIDPSPRAFSGGIYDEARRGWMYPLSRNEKGRRAFQNGVWNKYHIEAIGNSIKTWVNGVQCSNLVDDMTARGFICLQVHSIRKEDEPGAQVRWRDIRILEKDLEKYAWVDDPEVPQISFLINQITPYEMRHGWRLLWDGKTTKGWRGAKIDHFPKSGWEIKDGVLTVIASDGGESTGGGDIITEEVFSDFELELEFKITEGANSGIKYFVDAELNKGAGSAIGCEFQILDDQNHPDAKMGVKGNRTVASLYDLITAGNLNTPGRSKQFKGVGQWNQARIVSRNGVVEHWLNGEKAVEYDRYSQMFKALVAYSKYQKWEDFGQWPEGHILLQDHGDTVHFRSIKVREF
jgi:3-keto-disaccharide hydrolase